jgi:hypothetical protein
MPFAARIVSDLGVRAIPAARDMPAESGRAAALDGRHDLQLAEAHVTGVGVAPFRSVAAEDIRHLERRAGQKRPRVTRPASSPYPRGEMLERARNLAQRLEGDAGVERRGIEFLVPEQRLDHANIGLLLEQVRGKAVPQGVQMDGLVDLGHPRRSVAGPVELARRQRVYRVLPRKQPTLRPPDLPPCSSRPRRCGDNIT